jgi:selenocysteine lyase/cysteine desulfurase
MDNYIRVYKINKLIMMSIFVLLNSEVLKKNSCYFDQGQDPNQIGTIMSVMKLQATARASFYLYNTEQEVDIFINALHKVKKVFGV